jgi:hypothetical protein
MTFPAHVRATRAPAGPRAVAGPAVARPGRPRGGPAALLIAAAACCSAGTVTAQQPASIEGTVVNRHTGAAVEGALVRLTWTGNSTTVDSAGRFTLAGLNPGVGLLQIRSVGYRVGSWSVRLVAGEALTDTFALDPVPVELAEVVVPGRPDDNWRTAAAFEARRRRGGGYFITEEQIRQQHPITLVEILRMVPGVTTACNYFSCAVRMNRSPRPCSPEYYLDGYPATFATGPNFPIQAIRGIEIYPDAFSAPIELQRLELRCGVIAIWTRMDR